MNKLILLILLLILILIFSKDPFSGTEPIIPKVIHKIFLSSDNGIPPIEKNIQKAMNTWNLPGYTLKLWYINDCRTYLKDNFGQTHLNCFDNLIPYAYKADFMRYCILYNEGGWYSDWQQILLGSLDDYKNYEWVSCWDTTGKETKDNGCMQNGFIGSCKNNKILNECINRIIENTKTLHYGKNPWYPTGPCLLGDAFRKTNPTNFKLGYTENDKTDGPCFIINGKKIVINKCCIDKDIPSTNFKNGNNYVQLWKSRNIYK